jgi:hypothetical protein
VSKLSRPNLASGPATLRFLIAQHAVDNPGILDASYNEGKMWIGIESGYNLTRLDLSVTGMIYRCSSVTVAST